MFPFPLSDVHITVDSAGIYHTGGYIPTDYTSGCSGVRLNPEKVLDENTVRLTSLEPLEPIELNDYDTGPSYI